MSSSGLGQRLSAPALKELLAHTFQANLTAEAHGGRRLPVCIWGPHGIGKTELAEDFARERGWAFSYVAPAQFEEMGDFLGMPRIDAQGDTRFAPPAWVPREPGPGLLLLDDFNRASGRILRGTMQLMQRHETMAWRLPAGWQILATANPEGGVWQVSAMDPAMLSRMVHVSLAFTLDPWLRWAEQAGLDPRGLALARSAPGLLEQASPRAFTQLIRLLAPIPDWSADSEMVQALIWGCLEPEAAAMFLGLLSKGPRALPDPLACLRTSAITPLLLTPLSELLSSEAPPMDAILQFLGRLAPACDALSTSERPQAVANLKALLLLDALPEELVMVLATELAPTGALGKQVLSDPQVARRLLGG